VRGKMLENAQAALGLRLGCAGAYLVSVLGPMREGAKGACWGFLEMRCRKRW
jgi:hypothetical protein